LGLKRAAMNPGALEQEPIAPWACRFAAEAVTNSLWMQQPTQMQKRRLPYAASTLTWSQTLWKSSRMGVGIFFFCRKKKKNNQLTIFVFVLLRILHLISGQ
jgi:hypothetical protein